MGDGPFGGQGCDVEVGETRLGRAYQTREAQPGYAPDPDFSKLPPFDELVKLAFGEHGIIRDEKHPIARDLLGAAPPKSSGDDDDGLS